MTKLKRAEKYLKGALFYFEETYYDEGQSIGIAMDLKEMMKDVLSHSIYADVARAIVYAELESI